MINHNIVDDILTALNDEQVRNKLVDIIHQADRDNSTVSDDSLEINNKIPEDVQFHTTDEYLEMRQQLEAIKMSHDDMRKKLESEKEKNSKLDRQLLCYSGFKTIVELFKKYISIEPDILNSLRNTISHNDAVAFAATGFNIDNQKRLWDFIKSMVMNGNQNESTKTLVEIFEYFFIETNKCLPEPLHCFYNINVGDRFDNDIHIRVPDSKINGNVSEVILRGYYNTITGNIVRQSIVRI